MSLRWNCSYLGHSAVQGGNDPFWPHPLRDVRVVGRGGATLTDLCEDLVLEVSQALKEGICFHLASHHQTEVVRAIERTVKVANLMWMWVSLGVWE